MRCNAFKYTKLHLNKLGKSSSPLQNQSNCREQISTKEYSTSKTSDKGSGANSVFEDNGDCSGELGEMASQSNVGGVGRCEEGGGRVGQAAIV